MEYLSGATWERQRPPREYCSSSTGQLSFRMLLYIAALAEACQLDASRRVSRVPLIPLPIMSEPFQRIAMDIVGPLPKSHIGKRFVLVVCDYATRYPEAVPLRTTDAEPHD